MHRFNRRQVVTGSATLFAGTCVPLAPTAEAQTLNAAGPFFASASAGRGASPWLIHGAPSMLIKVSGSDVHGRFSAIQINTPPGLGPELHVHHNQNELFYMLSGRIGLHCGTERHVLSTGDTFMAPRGVPHAYVTLGEEPAHIFNLFDPADKIESFFAEYSAILNRNGPPDRAALANLYGRCDMQVLGPPLDATSFHS